MPVFRLSGARLLTLVVCFVAMAAQLRAQQRYDSVTYSLVPPEGWIKSGEKMVAGGVAFLGPFEKDFTVNINVLTDPAPHETLEQYIKAIHAQVTAGSEMTILHDSSAKILLGGTPAHAMLTQLRLKKRTDVPTLTVHQVYAMHDNRAYIVTLTYPKSVPAATAQKFIAAFNKLIASFQWKPVAPPKKP